MDRRNGSAIQLGNVPQVFHFWKVTLGNGHRSPFYLAGPQGNDSLPLGRQRENSYPIKETPQSKFMAAHISEPQRYFLLSRPF